jgi:SAM-dependent methyltransferase
LRVQAGGRDKRCLDMRTVARRKWMRAKLAVRRIAISSERRHIAVRKRLASRYLRGEGIEIGALHLPLSLPRAAHARYVDRMGIEGLRTHYPELDVYELVAPDIVDDGESLSSLADGSVDFVIANHLIEHCQDPIGTLQAYARVLREDGVLYLAAPDRRRTIFDRRREETSLEHLLRDHREGPAWSRAIHYEEWTRLAIGVPSDEVAEHAAGLEAQDYSIHFHTFTLTSFLGLMLHCREAYELPFEVLATETNDHEFIVIARRVANTGAGTTRRATSTKSPQARALTSRRVTA